ncbi:MAG: SOS response-associated peptidase [Myxococcota bacterium]
MCGRMTLTRSAEEIARCFALEAAAIAAGPDGRGLAPRYNLAPSARVLTVVRDASGARRAVWKLWGLVPAWSKDPAVGAKRFNARAETVATKPSFRGAFRRHRCLVVADGFYEWTPRARGHRAYWLHPPDGGLLAFAGLHERWQGEGRDPLETCTVITTEAGPDLAELHHRMPVLLSREAGEAWLDPAQTPDGLQALLAPSPAGTLTARPVSPWVNDPRHDDPGCLDPPRALPLALSLAAPRRADPPDDEPGAR